ncbi:hypothetical protein [Stenotrophomonas sp. Iso1]|nr:hypothetical protein [Stenotrophomonas sp. Iso1]
MFRKILIGMLGFLIVCLLGAAGYRFGQHLADQDNNAATAPRH